MTRGRPRHRHRGPRDFDRLFRAVLPRPRRREHRRYPGLRAGPLHLRPHRARPRRRASTWRAGPAKGSVFSFALPLFGAEAQTRPPLVLVAAGDERTRREVRRVAEEQGYATHEVADGVEAVEAALRLVPAAVVLDRVLPRLGAGEVAERLKDSPTTASIPLFVLAGRGSWASRAGAVHRLPSPAAGSAGLGSRRCDFGPCRAKPTPLDSRAGNRPIIELVCCPRGSCPTRGR